MPFNRSLYSISFALFTGGCCSLLLTLIYTLVSGGEFRGTTWFSPDDDVAVRCHVVFHRMMTWQ